MSRTVLITGGSRGIGLALSRRFAARGDRLLWVARTEAELEAGRGSLAQDHPDTDVASLATDLSVPAGPQAVDDWITDLGAEVDVLVHCAGFASWGLQHDIAEERDLAMFHLNMITPYLLTRRLLPGMKARGRGHVVFVASTAARVLVPGFVAYGATKAFLRAYGLGLGLEHQYEGSPVGVTVSCPAAVKDTGFRDEAGMQDTNVFDGAIPTTPDEVADDVMRAIDRRRPEVVSGRVMRWILPLLERAPRWAMVAAMRDNLR